jgi:hypothetical protein
MGLRVLGNNLPEPADYGLKIRSRTGFPLLFAWHYQRLAELSRVTEPTSEDVLLTRRLLTVLSIGKMLTICTAGRLNAERRAYAQRVQRSIDETRVQELRVSQSADIRKFLDFTRFSSERVPIGTPGANPIEGKVSLDPGVYSLKSLAKKQNQRFKQLIPIPVLRYLMRVEEGQFNYACEPSQPDGKQVIIVESGGKYRGITPYYSPLVHSTSAYRNLRRVLSGWGPDVSLDQSVGHERTRLLTETDRLVVSADASNFTDSIDLELATVFLEILGEDEFLTYLGSLKISTVEGIVQTPLPMMGLKGCYELGCVLLAYSVWLQNQQSNLPLKGMAHACDDLVGHGTLQQFEDSYLFIGASLNKAKTVVSKTVAIFCGQMYWRGKCVTPVRMNLTAMCGNTSGNVVLNMCRSFIDNRTPVWGASARRISNQLIRRACIRCVKGYNINFDLPTKLGGVRIQQREGCSLIKLLERRSVLLYALYNTPIVEDPPDRQTNMICYVRLGQPAMMPDGTILPSVTIPTTYSRSNWKRRKLEIKQKLESGELSDYDVFDYYYS